VDHPLTVVGCFAHPELVRAVHAFVDRLRPDVDETSLVEAFTAGATGA